MTDKMTEIEVSGVTGGMKRLIRRAVHGNLSSMERLMMVKDYSLQSKLA